MNPVSPWISCKITQICSCWNFIMESRAASTKPFWEIERYYCIWRIMLLLYLQSMTKFLSFAVIVFQNLSQLMCGHFAGTNQNGRKKQGCRKNSVTVICKPHFLQSHAISLRVLDCRKISACRCLRAYEKSDKVLLFFSNVKTSERPCKFKGTK